MQAVEERTVRMRAPDFGSAFVADEPSPRVTLPPRGRFRAGDRVRVEVSFGPLADEIDLFGVVTQDDDANEDGGPRLDIDRNCSAQLAYVLDVLGGQREAAARRHRRLASSLPVRWTGGKQSFSTRLADISTGGAFIVSERLPETGDTVSVQLRTGDVTAPLKVDAVVTWTRTGTGIRNGFGVSFRPQDPAVASRLQQMVRAHEG